MWVHILTRHWFWNKKMTFAKGQSELVNWSDWLKISQVAMLGGPQKINTEKDVEFNACLVQWTWAGQGRGRRTQTLNLPRVKGMESWNPEGQRSLLLSSPCTEAWWDYVGIMCPSARMQRSGLHPVEHTQSAWAVLLILHCPATWSATHKLVSETRSSGLNLSPPTYLGLAPHLFDTIRTHQLRHPHSGAVKQSVLPLLPPW